MVCFCIDFVQTNHSLLKRTFLTFCKTFCKENCMHPVCLVGLAVCTPKRHTGCIQTTHKTHGERTVYRIHSKTKLPCKQNSFSEKYRFCDFQNRRFTHIGTHSSWCFLILLRFSCSFINTKTQTHDWLEDALW